jgi:putative FmdB family regulatory protein
LPIYVYACNVCGARLEKLVRRIGEASAPACANCGAAAMQRAVTTFTRVRDLASQMADLDPVYRRRIDAAMANTSQADPMRLLNKLTPFSAADAPGDPVNF